MSALDAAHQPIGPTIDLRGNRGMVVVTAYETDETRSDGSAKETPVDDALPSSGTMGFDNLRVNLLPIGGGNDTFVYGFHGQVADRTPSTTLAVQTAAP